MKTKEATKVYFVASFFRRDDTTRTCDPLVPNQVYYQLYYIPNALLSKSTAKLVQGERKNKFLFDFFRTAA